MLGIQQALSYLNGPVSCVWDGDGCCQALVGLGVEVERDRSADLGRELRAWDQPFCGDSKTERFVFDRVVRREVQVEVRAEEDRRNDWYACRCGSGATHWRDGSERA